MIHCRARAFTLIEMLVVISLIALLVAILLPALAKARDAARLSVCSSNQRQIYVASYTYATDSKDRMPGNPVYSASWSAASGAPVDPVMGYYGHNSIYNGGASPLGTWAYLKSYANARVTKTGTNISFANTVSSIHHCPGSTFSFTGSLNNSISYYVPGWGVHGFNYWTAPNSSGTVAYISISNYASVARNGVNSFKNLFAIDLYNHLLGGNLTNPDGSGARFDNSNAYRSRSRQAYQTGAIASGAVLVPRGYSYPIYATRVGDLDANPIQNISYHDPNTAAGAVSGVPLQISPTNAPFFGVSTSGR
jgi:prepilin-type N-terminal cleavage/methylation domain-containing protein